MERYGTDKPDLRFELPMEELTPLFRLDGIWRIQKGRGRWRGHKGHCAEGETLSRKDLDTAVDTAKTLGAGGLIWMRKDEGKLVSPIVKYLKEQETAAIDARCGLANGDVLFIMADARAKVNDIMGRFRLYLGERYDLVRKGEDRFLWVVNFPLFEYSAEEKRYVARHHPFTSPAADRHAGRPTALDYERMRAKAYDLVLNGVEIGGGSIRIHGKDEQMEMFRLLGIRKKRRSSSSAFSSRPLRWARRPTAASPSASTAS